MKFKIYIIFLITSLLLLSTISKAQESYIKDRWDVKIGYAKPIEGYIHFNNQEITCKKVNLVVETNYGFSKYITGGVFASYSKFEFYDHKIINDTQQHELYRDSAVLITYSAKANIHLMPLIRKQKDSRFDFYVTAKAGGYHFKKTRFEYNAGLGMAIYPGRHFGFYGEYTYGNLISNSFNWRAGIVVKFNR